MLDVFTFVAFEHYWIWPAIFTLCGFLLFATFPKHVYESSSCISLLRATMSASYQAVKEMSRNSRDVAKADLLEWMNVLKPLKGIASSPKSGNNLQSNKRVAMTNT